MLTSPRFRQIVRPADLQYFAQTYKAYSSLPIPSNYLESDRNQVFGLYWRGQLISGFILGHGPTFRTIDVFAQPQHRPALYEQLSTNKECTEICCFFIAPAFRRHTFFNFAAWIAMSYAQVRHGRGIFIYCSCSRSLARLYKQTQASILLHQDLINGKPTFIFWAKRRHCVRGMLQIMLHKLQRILKISKARQRYFRFPKLDRRQHKSF